jgi:predicted RNase H-like HicB family nuclease
MNRYLIILEVTPTGYSAYSPDLPGCIATGRNREEVERTMRDAIVFHIDGLRESGLPVPQPVSSSAYVEVAAA